MAQAEEFQITERMEKVIATGDLLGLTDQERIVWYRVRCEMVGVDWRANPFKYLTLNRKLVLYPSLELAQQICSNRNISTIITDRQILGEAFCVTCRATDPLGRSADSMGAVYIKGLVGEAYCNALLKSESKARRRAVFALCGLGGTDDEDIAALGGERVQMAHSAPIAITGSSETVNTDSAAHEGTETAKQETANNGRQERIDALNAWKAAELPIAGDGCRVLENVLGYLPEKFAPTFGTLTDEQLSAVNHFIQTGERPRQFETPTVKTSHPEDAEPSSVSPPALSVQGATEDKPKCVKVPHYTPRDAENHKADLLAAPDYVCPDGKVLNTYLCKECSSEKYPVWHVGHSAIVENVPNVDGPAFKAQIESILRLSKIHNQTIPENLEQFTWGQARELVVELNQIRQENPPPRTQKKPKAEPQPEPPAVIVDTDPAEYVKYLVDKWAYCFRSAPIAKQKLNELMGMDRPFEYWCLHDGVLDIENCKTIEAEITRIGKSEVTE